MDIHQSLTMYLGHILKKDLLAEPVSEKDIARLKKYKLLPLLGILINLKYISSFDKIALNPLRYTRIRSWRINLQIKEQFRVYEAFENRTVVIVPYKGLSFTRQFYPNVFYRDSVDVDFAISSNDLQHIGDVMTSLGYVEAKGENDYHNVKKTRGFYIDYSWILFDKAEKVVCNVEFHWQAANSALYAPILFEEIIHELDEIEIKGRKIKTFTKPVQALLVICHHGLVDGWGKFRHLVDLIFVDQGLNRDEWESLLVLLEKYKISRVLVIGMAMIHQVFDYQSRNGVDISRERVFSSKLINLLRNDKLMLKWSEQPIKFWYYLKMRDNISDFMISVKKFLAFTIKEVGFKISRK